MKEIIKHLPRPDESDVLERLRRRFPGSAWTDGEYGLTALQIQLPGPRGTEAIASRRADYLRFEVSGEDLPGGLTIKRLPDNGVKNRRALDVYPLSTLREQDVLFCLEDAVDPDASEALSQAGEGAMTDLATALEVMDSGGFAEPRADGFGHLFYDRLQRQREVRIREVEGYVVLETPVIRGVDAERLQDSGMKSQRRSIDAFCHRLNASYGLAFLRTGQEVLIRGVVPRSVRPVERLAQAVRLVVNNMIALHNMYFFPLVGLLDAVTARAVMRLSHPQHQGATQRRMMAPVRTVVERPADRLSEIFKTLGKVEPSPGSMSVPVTNSGRTAKNIQGGEG